MEHSTLYFIILLVIFYLSISSADECPNGHFEDIELIESIPDTIRIGTYNTYWLFSQIKSENRYVPWKSPTDYLDHFKNIASQIAHLDVDLLNLVEIEGQCNNIGRELVTNAPYQNGKQHQLYIAKSLDTATKQHNGLITTLKLERNLTITDNRIVYPQSYSSCFYDDLERTTSVSKHYMTMFKLNQETPIILFSVHLKAIPNDPASCAKREAQGEVVINAILEEVAKFEGKRVGIMVIGDFNDYDSGIVDAKKSKPNSKVLERIREQLNLTNVLSTLNSDSLYSHWWDRNKNDVIDKPIELSLIDHILVSSHLMDAVSNVKVHTSLYPNGNLSFSDHWPVTFDFDKAKAIKAHSSQSPLEMHTCYEKTSLNSQVCSGNGSCVGTDECSCNEGFGGDQCDQFECLNCNADGSYPSACSGPGKCKCKPGYKNAQCSEQYALCNGLSASDQNVCSGHGTCELNAGISSCNCIRVNASSYYGDTFCNTLMVTVPSTSLQSYLFTLIVLFGILSIGWFVSTSIIVYLLCKSRNKV